MKHLLFHFTLILASTFPLAAQLPEGIVDTQEGDAEPPTPEESLELITVPEGFKATLFAGEPDVAQPIAINYDDRGRLWVAESFSYIEWKRNGRDRILIFEDTDKDGHFDSRKVFWDKGNHVSGFQIGHGGVWVCDAPNLLFIPDGDRDDTPDGEPEVVLDGWSTEAEHNFFNGLTWGPDGWLYGRHGIKKPSLVGRPGTLDPKRTPLSCCIWRYHPKRKKFELYADGTINPWGLDWNAEGQAFITTSVIDHLWHLVPGARYKRWIGRGTDSLNSYSYNLMEPSSDHRHWTGGETERRQRESHGHAGGGHSHCGLMIYQSDKWPEQYRGKAFFSNVLGHRINMDSLERSKSGYVGRHGEDLLVSTSDWFRATDVKQGPHGEVMISEWTDFGECHDRDGIHRSSGRIYRVQHGENPPAEEFDIAEMNTIQLVGLLSHENEWWRRHALRNLYERGGTEEKVKAGLIEAIETGSVRNSITSLQALHAIGAINENEIRNLFDKNKADSREAIRAQIISLAFFGDVHFDERAAWLAHKISEEKSQLVQLWMAAALQMIPLASSKESAIALSRIPISQEDRNLVLMRWYGIEPLVEHDPAEAMKIALEPGHPYLSRAIARRAVSANATNIVITSLAENPKSKSAGPILEGLLLALPARRSMPENWKRLKEKLQSTSDKVTQKSVLRLALCFGDPDAEKAMVSTVLSRDATGEERIDLIRMLVSKKSEKLATHLSSLLNDPVVGVEAIRAISTFPEASDPSVLIELFSEKETSSEARTAILETLSSRPNFADGLVHAVALEQLSPKDIPTYIARQIVTVSTKAKAFSELMGLNAKETKDKSALIAKWKNRLNEETLASANPEEGQKVFQRICAACHKMYGEGQEIGPDLTGSNRHDLDYFLINVLFPAEDVNEAYQLVTLVLKDGRTLTGNIAEENGEVLTFRQIGQETRIDVSEIESRTVSELSLMPPGLIDNLNRDDVRDLVGFLRTREAPKGVR